MFVINNDQCFLSEILRVVGPLGEKLDILVPWDFKLKTILIMKIIQSRST